MNFKSIVCDVCRYVTPEFFDFPFEPIQSVYLFYCSSWQSSNCSYLPNIISIFKLLFGYSVWQKLEEENADFFRAYYIRLKLKKQIILFNNLLEHQYHLMKYPVPPKVPLAPIQNGIHPMQGKLCFTFLLT